MRMRKDSFFLLEYNIMQNTKNGVYRKVTAESDKLQEVLDFVR